MHIDEDQLWGCNRSLRDHAVDETTQWIVHVSRPGKCDLWSRLSFAVTEFTVDCNVVVACRKTTTVLFCWYLMQYCNTRTSQTQHWKFYDRLQLVVFKPQDHQTEGLHSPRTNTHEHSLTYTQTSTSKWFQKNPPKVSSKILNVVSTAQLGRNRFQYPGENIPILSYSIVIILATVTVK